MVNSDTLKFFNGYMDKYNINFPDFCNINTY